MYERNGWGNGVIPASMDAITPKKKYKMISPWWLPVPRCGCRLRQPANLMISLQRRQCCFFLRIKNSEGYENRGFGCCPGMKLQHLLFMSILELDGLVVVHSLPSLRSNCIYGCRNLSSGECFMACHCRRLYPCNALSQQRCLNSGAHTPYTEALMLPKDCIL